MPGKHQRTIQRLGALFTVLLVSGATLAGCSLDEGSPFDAEPSSSSSSGTPSDAPSTDGEESADSAGSQDSSTSENGKNNSDRNGASDSSDGDGADSNSGDDADPDENSSDSEGETTDTKDEEPDLPKYIAFGENSERVAELQQRLKELGYHITEVDGVYGGETQQALWALQKAGGLRRDGVAGPETHKALENAVTPKALSTSGKTIEIDIERQLVLAVDDGQIVKTLNAASGNGKRFAAKGHTYVAATPRGEFSIYRQIDGMHSSTLELGNMWRPKYFNGGIAVHGSSSVPPFPASHGCVRVSHDAMNWLWDEWGAPEGTPVLVY